MTILEERNKSVFQSNNKSASSSDSLTLKKPLTIEEEMFLRTKTMKEACKSFGLDQPGNDSLHKPYSWEYLINKKHHLVWCNVFKSGSTSWLAVFLQLLNINQNKTAGRELVLARTHYPRPSVNFINILRANFTHKSVFLRFLLVTVWLCNFLAPRNWQKSTSKMLMNLTTAVDELLTEMKNATSFIVARHPLERIAYRDKIVDIKPPFYAYRPFITKILRQNRKKYTKDDRPTFSEFVDYILKENDEGKVMNEHWIPVYKFCNPCQVNFTDIVKFETSDRDQVSISSTFYEQLLRVQTPKAQKGLTI